MITGVGMAHHLGASRVQSLPCTIAALLLSAVLAQTAPDRDDRRRRVDHDRLGGGHGHREPRRGGDDLPVRVRHVRVLRAHHAAAGCGRGVERGRRPRDALEPHLEHDLPLPAGGDQRGRGRRAARTARCAPARRRAAPSISSRAATGVNALRRDARRRPSTRARWRPPCASSTARRPPTARRRRAGDRSRRLDRLGDRRDRRPEAEHAVQLPRRGHQRGGHHPRRQPHLHDVQGADRRGHHALDDPPDVGLGADDHGHRERRRFDSGRAREAGLPLLRRLRADRHGQRQRSGAFTLTAPALFVTARLRVVTRTASSPPAR